MKYKRKYLTNVTPAPPDHPVYDGLARVRPMTPKPSEIIKGKLRLDTKDKPLKVD